ncbi:acetyl-CoA synthetase-like protein [Flammula alnicola]|nr:acetyl-CoA synthetase-like protein [Flammula alnicola]
MSKLTFAADAQPQYPLYSFHEDGASDITNISYFEFRRAADRVAHYFRPGRQGPEGEIIAVVALSDSLLYHAVSLGLMRGGVVPFLMSPRNIAPAIIKMLKEVNCHKLLTTQETLKTLVSEIKADLAKDSPEFALEVLEMPPLSKIFPKLGHEKPEDPFEEYPKVAVRPALDDALLYLHSSGSTGFPKSIKETFRIICHWASFPPMPEMSGWSIGCMHLPPFHTLGVIASIIHATYALSPVILYPPVATSPSMLPIMPTPDNIIDHLRRTKAMSLITIPTLLAIWAQDKESVDFLATLKMVGYSGGSVPTKLGNFMTSAGVTLAPIYGGTEFGGPTYMARRPGGENDWEWFALDERLNVRWEPQGDGSFECQFLTNEFHQVSVENMGDEKGYATSDLFIPHPTVPGFWRIVGRKDDVIIHTSGEKTVPAPMENIISNSPYVMGVIMFGREHDQPGVLIELKPPYAVDVSNEAEVIKARNLVWPIVEEANRVAPAFSKVFKELILITDPNRPLPRAGKGTVMRKAALTVYNDDIEALYATIESAAGAEAVPPPPAWTKEETDKWLKEQIEDVLPDITFSITGDLFEQGMDSLGATILRRRIVGALQSDEDTAKAAEFVSQNTIYQHPTIESLSEFLVATVIDPDSVKASANRSDVVEEMIAKYNTGLSAPISAGVAANGTQVLITGSTGNLGSQITETLLRDPSVTKIYALNRVSGNPLSKHTERFTDKGFDTGLLSSEKLVFLEGDITQKNLGLSKEVYQELLNNITVIIHTAWRLDFNLSLASFEPNVRGTRNLVDLARASSYGSSVKFMFTSSVASGISWDRSRGPYPEEVLLDAQYSVGTGYGESKYVTERILSQSGIKATSFRVGQIAGGKPNGAWAITDWVPILVKSSIALNALPSLVGTSSWVPMDGVAQSIIDVALSSESPAALNIVHPRPVAFNSLASAINDGLVSEGVVSSKLPIVPVQEWFSLLESRATGAKDEDIKQIPAIKLLQFFQATSNADAALRSGQRKGNESGGMAEFSTTKAQGISKTMKELPSIGDAQAHLWVKYWKSAGLFN